MLTLSSTIGTPEVYPSRSSRTKQGLSSIIYTLSR